MTCFSMSRLRWRPVAVLSSSWRRVVACRGHAGNPLQCCVQADDLFWHVKVTLATCCNKLVVYWSMWRSGWRLVSVLQVHWCAIAACGGHAGDLLQCYSQAGDYCQTFSLYRLRNAVNIELASGVHLWLTTRTSSIELYGKLTSTFTIIFAMYYIRYFYLCSHKKNLKSAESARVCCMCKGFRTFCDTGERIKIRK